MFILRSIHNFQMIHTVKQFNIFPVLFRKVKWSVLHILWDLVLVAKLAMALVVFPQLLHDNPDILWG